MPEDRGPLTDKFRSSWASRSACCSSESKRKSFLESRNNPFGLTFDRVDEQESQATSKLFPKEAGPQEERHPSKRERRYPAVVSVGQLNRLEESFGRPVAKPAFEFCRERFNVLIGDRRRAFDGAAQRVAGLERS